MNDTLSLIIDVITSTFILKALLVGILVAVSSSFLGIFLVLKKYSMIGDGLAHVSFATIAIALVLGMAPLLVSIPLVILASFLILKLNEKAEIHGDAAIGLVASFSVAFGYLIASYTNGFTVDLSSYLFGSILLITNLDVYLSIALSVVVISTVLYLYNNLFALTYDEEFSKVLGINTNILNYIISILTSITVVLGIRVVGTMLISSLIIFPTVTALQVSKGFKSTIKYASIVSILSVIIGVILSIIINSPSGATIVVINGIFFILFYSKKKLNLK